MNADDLIYLTPYLPQWADMAALEIKQIKNILQDLDIEKIEHIGSTAVPGLASKPVIDIAIKVGRIENGKDAIRPLESFGYLYLAENSDEKHMFFVTLFLGFFRNEHILIDLLFIVFHERLYLSHLTA